MNISQYYSRPHLAIRRLREYLIDQATLNDLKKGHDSYQRYIVLCHYRAGSNFLLSLLKSHEAVIAYSELFFTNTIAWSDGVYGRRNTNKLIYMRDNNPVEFLDEFAFRKYGPKIKAVGFKYKYAQFEQPRWNLVNEYLKDIDVKIIHLKRDNILDIIVSENLVRKTKQASFVSRREMDKMMRNLSTITLDYERLLRRFRNLERRVEKCESYFQQLQSITVKYSELRVRPRQETARIYSFLDIPVTDIDEIRSPLLEIKIEQNREIISNYEELAVKFAGTKYEWFFK